MLEKEQLRKDYDKIFLNKMLSIAGRNPYLIFRAYVYYAIVRTTGWIKFPKDSYDGCGISSIIATGKNDPFYSACQLHDALYSNIKG